MSLQGMYFRKGEQMNNYFYYKDGILYNKTTRSNRAIRDKPCSLSVTASHGYRTVRLNDKSYLQHRVIWELFNGPIEDGVQIDHINHDRSDNRIENLRICTSRENNRNRPLYSKNKTGHHGVSIYNGLFYVSWNSRYHSRYDTLEEAILVRKELEKNSDFHRNHGK